MSYRYFRMGRRLLARIAVGATLASAAGGAALATASTAHATTYTVTLTASPSSPTVGQTVALETQVTPSPSGSGLTVTLYDEDSHQIAGFCGSQQWCYIDVTRYDNTPHHYISYLATADHPDPPTGLVAQSNLLTVTWTGTWTWTDTLSAANPTPEAATSTTLHADTNGNTSFEGYSNEVLDLTGNTVVGNCGGGTCDVTVTSRTPQTRQYQARIVDSGGNVIASSNVVSITWLPYYSDQCTSPLLTVVDGWVGGTYARVRVQQNGTDTVVCYRLDQGTTLQGGQIVVSPGAVTVGLPTTDTNDTACSSATGNAVPQPHPLVAASTPLGDVRLDTYASTGTPAAWICVTAGPLHERILVPVSAGGVPGVAVNSDPIAQPAPAPDAGPAGDPSSTCVANGGSSAAQYIDATVGVTHEWLSVWQRSSGELDVCARMQGPVTEGGLVAVTLPVVPGGVQVTPVYGVGSDTSACSFAFVVSEPVSLLLATNQPGSTPVVVCAGAAGAALAVTVGATVTTGPVQPPSLPAFTPDPDNSVL